MLLNKDFKKEGGEDTFALGHRFFSILPGLVIWSTVFLREHNTVCDQLIEEHPDWSDEQIFQTARNAITGNKNAKFNKAYKTFLIIVPKCHDFYRPVKSVNS